MTLGKMLLCGVSLCALAITPVLARESAPEIHLAQLGARMTPHVKTRIYNPNVTNFTSTVTFSGSLSTATAYKVKTTLLGETWLLHKKNGTCIQPKKQKWTGLPKKTLYAKISTSTSTGTTSSCPSSQVLTFQDIDYDLITKKAKGKTDSVMGDLIANNFKGYDLKLVATINVAITK